MRSWRLRGSKEDKQLLSVAFDNSTFLLFDMHLSGSLAQAVGFLLFFLD
jgi:hypothetical protein